IARTCEVFPHESADHGGAVISETESPSRIPKRGKEAPPRGTNRQNFMKKSVSGQLLVLPRLSVRRPYAPNERDKPGQRRGNQINDSAGHKYLERAMPRS